MQKSKNNARFSFEDDEKSTRQSGDTVRITPEDIQAVQSIPRKSVNDFTGKEIEKTKTFARRYLKELGAKSPFFRAWFGDWRANDTSTTQAVEVTEKILPNNTPLKDIGVILRTKLKNKELFRGTVKNNDTGYDIQVGAFGYNDTLIYAQRELKRKATGTDEVFRRINALCGIKELIENAVLLDTEVISGSKNPNRSFMHSFYTVVRIDGFEELVKIKVDEIESPTNPAKRFYNLNNFEIINKNPLAARWVLKPSTDASGSKGITSATISISDLFNIVKQNDKNFKPKPCSLVVNEDGMPKVVYHGSTAEFSVFKQPKNGALGIGYYFAESKENMLQDLHY